MWLRILLALALLFSSLGVVDTPVAHAQDDAARAVELITQANKSYDAGAFKDALEKYKQAYAITEDPRVLYRIGLTYENLANYQRAREHLELYLLAEPDSKYAGRVKSKVDNLRKLEETLQATIRVETTPAGASVWVDTEVGKPAGVTPVRLPVGPGSHELIVQKEGFDEVRKTVTVEAGKSVETQIDLEGGEAAVVAETTDTTTTDTSEETASTTITDAEMYTGQPTNVRLGPSTGLSVLSWISIGLGWAILAFSGTTTGVQQDAVSPGISTGGFLVGAGLITLGAYFLWIKDYTNELPNRQVTAPSAVPPARAFGVGLRF